MARMISKSSGIFSYYYRMYPDWLGQIRNYPEVVGMMHSLNPYAIETMVVSKATIAELEKIQASVSRFILQVPRSSSEVVGSTDAH